MTVEFRPINDRSQPAPPPVRGVLSDADYLLVENDYVTWPVMLVTTLDRLNTENRYLRQERDTLIRMRDHLATENTMLRAENARLSVIKADREQRRTEAETALSASESERRRIERYGWLWCGLFVVTFLLAVMAASFVRWD